MTSRDPAATQGRPGSGLNPPANFGQCRNLPEPKQRQNFEAQERAKAKYCGDVNEQNE